MASKMRLTKDANSPVKKVPVDNTGSAIGCARLDPADSYGAVPMLLKKYIDTGSQPVWEEIRQRIDNTCQAVSAAMQALDKETSFSGDVRKQIKSGKKLFFKPNLVSLPSLDPRTHNPVLWGTCLPWEFLAAVMRWFHDEIDISYHQMALGEGGAGTAAAAFTTSRIWDRPVTTQALMEGKSGDNYGGWGFYFARKYLAESHDSRHPDDPMKGYDESLSGHCLPPGQVSDKLLIYDLNKIANNRSDGREIPVANGINFKNIIIHKAIVGGNPGDSEDLNNWPGCVLVNVTKLKIHLQELFTAACKNLGIGLYPMEVNDSREPGKYRWKYAVPNFQVPILKMSLPHNRWIIRYDEKTLMPAQSPDGEYIWDKTGGIEATMLDMLQAIHSQDISMIHVVDAVEATNINHCAPGATAVPEGLVFASKDMVAIDTCGARYLFSMVPRLQADQIRQEHNFGADVIQKVPMPVIKGKDIVNDEGYECAFSRYGALKRCEETGLGQQRFYVVGKDLWQGGDLASQQQHLGRLDNGVFNELNTSTMYHTPNKILWDLQATCLKYLELNDTLTGSDFKRLILEALDENRDGIIDYLEMGRRDSALFMAYANYEKMQSLEPLSSLEFRFLIATTQLKHFNRDWNSTRRNFGEHTWLYSSVSQAWAMASIGKELPDPLFLGRHYGKGKWPSMQYAMQRLIGARVFGQKFPELFDTMMSPYGFAFKYADIKFNAAGYSKNQQTVPNGDIIGSYHRALERGAGLLPFIFCVPRGMGSIGGVTVSNVEETDNPDLVFTARFDNGEVWKNLDLSRFDLK